MLNQSASNSCFNCLVCACGILLIASSAAASEERKIMPPPENRALLPAPLTDAVMVRAAGGKLNVMLGGWGGARLILAKDNPDEFRKYCRSIREQGLNCIRPLWNAPYNVLPPTPAKDDYKWAPFDWAAMDCAVAITQEEQIYLLVDCHNWLVNDGLHTHEAEWLELWGWIVERYRAYQHLIWEGFNEPQNNCPCLAGHYQKWVDLVRAKGSAHLCVVSPFWDDYFAINDPQNNWAQCRHFYFNAKNSATPDKGRSEAQRHLGDPANPQSALSAVNKLGCGFFMTEGGITGAAQQAGSGPVAGVQRMIDVCEQNRFGWCLWAFGDWSDGYHRYGVHLRFNAKYPLIDESDRGRR